MKELGNIEKKKQVNNTLRLSNNKKIENISGFLNITILNYTLLHISFVITFSNFGQFHRKIC